MSRANVCVANLVVNNDILWRRVAIIIAHGTEWPCCARKYLPINHIAYIMWRIQNKIYPKKRQQ